MRPVQNLPLGQIKPAARSAPRKARGLMPDGTSRFSYKGQTIFHYMGC